MDVGRPGLVPGDRLLDTIAAIATAPGVGAIGVIRVSGPLALSIAQAILRSGKSGPDLSRRGLHVGWVVDPDTGERIDQAVLLVFPGPTSFTGEDVVEIQGHGGPAIMRRLLALVLGQGARLASPGEFTRRAFLSGRIDLVQAEAIGELVSARGERALQAAIGQLEGRLSHEVMQVRQALFESVARIEAAVDFPEDVAALEPEEIMGALARQRIRIDELLAGARAGEVARSGARVAIVGQPNVGKSSLMNALLRSERAIVTAVPGTTRDVLEADLEIAGIPIRLVDTAGIRPARDEIEKEGVARSWQQVEGADLVLLVHDSRSGLDATDHDLAARAGDRPVLRVASKVDLLRSASADPSEVGDAPWPAGHLGVSSLTRQGLDELEAAIAGALLSSSPVGVPGLAVNARHQGALRQARAHLTSAIETLDREMPLDLLSGDLRTAIRALGQITGLDPAEELLDLLFSRFCLGK